jgi:hypothetical protein
MFRCPSCEKGFTYWVPSDAAHPKVKCTFCGNEFFPKGEPAAAPAEPPAPAEKAPAA